MKKRSFAGLLALLLLLLAGCTGGEPSGPPAPAGPNVSVNWDALGSGGSGSAPRRLSDGWMDDLVPGQYGQLVPYIGSEQKVRYDTGDMGEGARYSTDFLYGLCTTDGLLVTDAVYNSVWTLSWYDPAADDTRSLPVWTLRRTLPDPDSFYGYDIRVGLAAADGSWYTGLRFLGGEFSTLGANQYSALLMEDNETAVLLSLADGSELARYTPWDFLPADADPEAAQWFFSGLGWGGLWSGEDCFCFDLSFNGLQGGLIWIDARTGRIFTDPSRPRPDRVWDGHMRFDGGWYDDPPLGGPLVLHYNDGSEETIPYDASRLGEFASASSRHLVFRKSYGEGRSDCTLTDHALNVLCTVEDGDIWLGSDDLTGRQRPMTMEELDPASWTYRYTVMDDNGKALASSWSYLNVCGGYLAVADDTCYRMVDLNDGGRELFRLPRWAALDSGADLDPWEDGARYFFAEGIFLGAWEDRAWHAASYGGFTIGQLFERSYVDAFGEHPGAVRFYAGEGPGGLDDPETAQKLLAPYGILEGGDFVMRLPAALGGAAADVPVPTYGFYASFDGQSHYLISNVPLQTQALTETVCPLDDRELMGALDYHGLSCDLRRCETDTWSCDVDGDGESEALVLIRNSRDADGYLILQYRDPVFYALLLVDGGEVSTVAIQYTSYTTDPTGHFSPGVPIVADLNGDGRCEVILQHCCWEWGHYSAFTCDDGWWHEVLRADYGN